MTVTLELPEELEAFVRAEIARGEAEDEADFLTKTVEMYRELKHRHEDLRAQVRESMAQYERGEARPLDTQATQREARRRFLQDH
jgi:Arc/MetJ-type ribon-helix-helix transcriptional regulator